MKTNTVPPQLNWPPTKRTVMTEMKFFGGGITLDNVPHSGQTLFADVLVSASKKHLGEWMVYKVSGHQEPLFSDEELIGERLHYSLGLLKEWVEVNPYKRAGVPVLRGTRFTVSQLLAELADGRSAPEIAKDFDLDETAIVNVLQGFSIYLDRPVSR